MTMGGGSKGNGYGAYLPLQWLGKGRAGGTKGWGERL